MEHRHGIHTDQDEGHEGEKDAVILFDLEWGFFLGFHGNGIVSQMMPRAIVRTNNVRRGRGFSRRQDCYVMGVSIYWDKNYLSTWMVKPEPMTEAIKLQGSYTGD